MEKELEYIDKRIQFVKNLAKPVEYKIPVAPQPIKVVINHEAAFEEEIQTLNNIKQALLELQAIKNAEPSEALVSLRSFKNGMISGNAICITKSYFDDKFLIIENALLKAEKLEKAWEVVKEKGVNVGEFKKDLDWDKFDYSFYLCYYKHFSLKELTEEEFELIKEMIE